MIIAVNCRGVKRSAKCGRPYKGGENHRRSSVIGCSRCVSSGLDISGTWDESPIRVLVDNYEFDASGGTIPLIDVPVGEYIKDVLLLSRQVVPQSLIEIDNLTEPLEGGFAKCASYE